MKPETVTVFPCMWLLLYSPTQLNLHAPFFLYMLRHWCDNINTSEELESSVPASSARACSERDPTGSSFFGWDTNWKGKEKKAARNWSDAPTRRGCFTWFSWVSLFLLITPSVPPQCPNFPRSIFISYYFYSPNNHFSLQRWQPGTPPPLVRLSLWPRPLKRHWVPAISSFLSLD